MNPPRRLLRDIARWSIGLAVGVGLLWLLFRDTNWTEVGRVLKQADLRWLGLAVLTLAINYVVRVQRWRYLVEGVRPVAFRALFSATQIGSLGNFTLPGRIGEIVRALVLARLARMPFPQSLALAALDRATDLAALVLVILIALFAFTPEHDVIIDKEVLGWEVRFPEEAVFHAEVGVAAVMVVVMAGLVGLYLNQQLARRIAHACLTPFSATLAHRIDTAIDHFAQGLEVLRSRTRMALAMACSLLVWLLYMGVIVFALTAFGIRAPWYTALVVQAVVAAATSIPGAPGFIGQFHAAVIISLVMVVPDLPPAEAKAVAIIAYFINIAVVAVLGGGCLLLERIALTDLGRRSVEIEAEEHAQR